jgi:hypothetical protein
LNGYGVGCVLRLLLAFLLHNELLGHTLVFFVDGHHWAVYDGDMEINSLME